MTTKCFTDWGQNPLLYEHDACAIFASVRKGGRSTHGNLKRTIEALGKMGHRSGDVQGEGDGCGVLTDIPRRLWSQALAEMGRPTWLSEDKRFCVGHIMIPADQRENAQDWQRKVLPLIADAGIDLLLERPGITRRQALGRLARSQEPIFWQIAGVLSHSALEEVPHRLFDLTLAIERETPLHVASLSNHCVVYKVRGSVETLYHYYPELRSPDFTSAVTIGHARYSTNTTTAFERVQPFSLLGHNGEINTIVRLRQQAQMLGIQLVQNGSDSQDLNRVLEALIHRHGFSLIEAIELVFPPILNEIETLPPTLSALYNYYRQSFGPFAQGPAAIVARNGTDCAFSVDALGLRPLWFGETEKECFFSSEKGVVPLDLLKRDPKPLSPGEKMAISLLGEDSIEVLDYPAIQARLLDSALDRFGSVEQLLLFAPAARESSEQPEVVVDDRSSLDPLFAEPPVGLLAALGWSQDDQIWARALADRGQDPVASTGFDGPLAALSQQVQNLSDYFKETVAVVTNPAIDREREQEHFSTRTIVGPRPSLSADPVPRGWTMACPILVAGHACEREIPDAICRKVAAEQGSLWIEDLVSIFDPERVAKLSLTASAEEGLERAAERLAEQAVKAADKGTELLVLDDALAFVDGRNWIDPHLALATIDRALRAKRSAADPSQALRRSVGIVLRSGAIRNLHDTVLALAVGADAVAPYLLLDIAVGSETSAKAAAERLSRAVCGLRVGLEKVISTMGIHELRGYGRIFASIGLSTPLARVMEMPNYGGSDDLGLTWEDLDRDTVARQRLFIEPVDRLARVPRFNTQIAKPVRQLAQGRLDKAEAFAQIREQEQSTPVALRHVIGFAEGKGKNSSLTAKDVDAEITGHSLPFVLASMSFGSQSEIAYRAYAEAAYYLNIVALNGEGGEIADLMGKYPHNRGQQIASGRFGVNVDLLNASNLLEIKVGQGAKPGEGGYLPGRKVSFKVARARHVAPGTDLISPSNNHDIYSIEDLAQFIEELKTANPKARVAVKVPVVPGIGVICVGIAKAGADIINLTGYDGGTGAARSHSIRHVGLPAEIGLAEAQRALTASGMRRRVELWADGGIRSPDDVVKLMCLGANRVGFGTLALLALGCTLCRNCQAGDCHMGITTQIESSAEASARGLKRFKPQNFEQATQQLVTLFESLGQEVKVLSARLGIGRLQDIVGRTDLLEQASHHDCLDLGSLLARREDQPESAPIYVGVIPLRRPRNHLTTVVSNLVMEAVAAGERVVAFEDDRVTPVDRALGTHLAGALARYKHHWNWQPGHNGVGGQPESWRQPVNANRTTMYMRSPIQDARLRFYASSVPGNGLGAFSSDPVHITVEGGAQDGVGKGLHRGRVVVLKGYNHDGVRIDGSVGKGLGYGAIGGVIIVQGNADSRACVRLSGADVIIGGELLQPVEDSLGYLGARANVKGFLCEYMTAGRVLVLGDPGPWMCAGMTGGTLYLRLQPELNLDLAALQRRIARGAEVDLRPVDASDDLHLHEMLHLYADELIHNHQVQTAECAVALLDGWEDRFVKIVPRKAD